MAKSSLVDPWTTMKELLIVSLREVNLAYDQFNEALNKTNTETDPSYKKKRKKLQTKLDSAKKIAGQMDLAVRAISRSRSQFKNVDDEDLASRQSYVSKTQSRLREVQEGIRSQRTRDKVAADRRAALTTSNAGNSNSLNPVFGSGNSSNSNSNAGFMQQQMDEQKEIRGQQDEILDNMVSGVENLGEKAKVMNTQLDEEAQLLAQFELEMEEAQAKMNFVMRGMSKLLKTKDSCQLWLILFLLITIIILSFFVFYVD